eukprot:14564806-Heterocapsa_arctica.AAC.1
MLERDFEAQHMFQAQMLLNNDQRSARNLMVIAIMPEDRSNTFKQLQKPSKPYTPVCAHL